MPGQRLVYKLLNDTIDVRVVVGYMPTTRALAVDQTEPEKLDQWWWDAGGRRPVGVDKPTMSIEYIASYPRRLGYLMMIQVLWVPDTDRAVLEKNSFDMDRLTTFGDGLATIDGGKVGAPARLRIGPEAPHSTYPFFAYNSAYYKPLKGQPATRTFRHKDYASAAGSHSTLIFDCVLVAKLKTEVAPLSSLSLKLSSSKPKAQPNFGVLDSFIWGMDNYKEAVLKRRTDISPLMTQVLANEYPNTKLEWLTDPAKIDTLYDPSATGSGTGSKKPGSTSTGGSKTYD
ncbi:hypothetical protein WME79_01070 [Sorangium sp. So ce726]|uniref:hypothetical protein n=1 Tax=Sorangium sp. So ce726 TaxID=3133319 RepID=UPI003F61795C